MARDYHKSKGDTFTLRGPRTGGFRLTAPDGSEWTSPAVSGKVPVWVPQEGTWAYEWMAPDAPYGSIFVGPAVVAEPVVEAETPATSVPVTPRFDPGRIEVT